MTNLQECLHCIARPRLYTIEQWYALILSVVCFSIGLWGACTASPVSQKQAWPFYSLEVALAFAVLALLWFAFSTYPRNRNGARRSPLS